MNNYIINERQKLDVLFVDVHKLEFLRVVI